VLALVALVAITTGTRAQPATGEPAAGESRRPSPSGALWRSALVPGWGQLYNGSPVKALVVAAGRAALIVRAVEEQREANDLEAEALALDSGPARDRLWRERNRALYRRDDFVWWSVFALVVSMIEAYVDAALHDFDEEFEGVVEPEIGVSDGASVTIGIGVSF
jgi:hypothetical protein